jgi:hypothetical protein
MGREPIKIEGGTTFTFVTTGIKALDQAVRLHLEKIFILAVEECSSTISK